MTISDLTQSEDFTLLELQLAFRNHGTPLEALRYPVTPVGLHYLLTHYDIPAVTAEDWKLRVGGLVERELSFSLEDLRARPSVEILVTMECAGNGRAKLSPRPITQPWLHEAVGTAEWRGVPLPEILDEAGVAETAVEVVFRGLDHGIEGGVEQNYERSVPVAEARRDEILLAYEVNGQPLPPQHGFPLRLVVPGSYGMANVKWLEQITLVDEPFEGYQQQSSYRLRQEEDEEGEPVSRMAPRALMVPPGIPGFPSRERTIDLGTCELTGRAWSGWAPIVAVEVSTDGGGSWAEATLEDASGPWAWTGWSYGWEPPGAGEFELVCRARDAAGNEQPLQAPWNLGGYANNSVQRITVTVRA